MTPTTWLEMAALRARKLPKEFREFFLFSRAYICRVASARLATKNHPPDHPVEVIGAGVNPDHDFASFLRKH
jgi:hypothetical protein